MLKQNALKNDYLWINVNILMSHGLSLVSLNIFISTKYRYTIFYKLQSWLGWERKLQAYLVLLLKYMILHMKWRINYALLCWNRTEIGDKLSISIQIDFFSAAKFYVLGQTRLNKQWKVWSGFTLFAIPSTWQERNTAWQNQNLSRRLWKSLKKSQFLEFYSI